MLYSFNCYNVYQRWSTEIRVKQLLLLVEYLQQKIKSLSYLQILELTFTEHNL